MINMNVLFKKMQKDDKKEVLVYEVKGDELSEAQSLVEMAGTIVILQASAGSNETSEIQAEFASLQRDSKKTSLKFNIKGDNEKASSEYYKLAGMNVNLTMQSSQMSIDEFYDDDHEGVQYKINQDGTVDVDPNQMTMDEVESPADQDAEDQEPGQEEKPSNVTDISEAPRKRGRPRKEEVKEKQVAEEDENPLPPLSDDDLPF